MDAVARHDEVGAKAMHAVSSWRSGMETYNGHIWRKEQEQSKHSEAQHQNNHGVA